MSVNGKKEQELFLCVLCGHYYTEDDMVIYKRMTHQGKCRECIRELERQRKGMNVIRCENSLANSKSV